MSVSSVTLESTFPTQRDVVGTLPLPLLILLLLLWLVLFILDDVEWLEGVGGDWDLPGLVAAAAEERWAARGDWGVDLGLLKRVVRYDGALGAVLVVVVVVVGWFSVTIEDVDDDASLDDVIGDVLPLFAPPVANVAAACCFSSCLLKFVGCSFLFNSALTLFQ